MIDADAVRTRRAAIAPAVAALAFVLGVGLAGCSSSSSTDGKYGTTPAFLPKSEISADGVLTATVKRPALTSNGDAVLVRTDDGSALVTVTGPDVPGEGLPVQKENTTCTWTVTMSAATGRVPIVVSDFSALDHLGGVSHPTIVAGTRRPPAVLAPGAKVTFKIRTVMRTGEGLIRWAPGSPHILASWDFTVEID